MWVFPKIGGKPPKWMVKIMENPIRMDDLGGPPLFLETPMYVFFSTFPYLSFDFTLPQATFQRSWAIWRFLIDFWWFPTSSSTCIVQESLSMSCNSWKGINEVMSHYNPGTGNLSVCKTHTMDHWNDICLNLFYQQEHDARRYTVTTAEPFISQCFLSSLALQAGTTRRGGVDDCEWRSCGEDWIWGQRWVVSLVRFGLVKCATYV